MATAGLIVPVTISVYHCAIFIAEMQANNYSFQNFCVLQ